MPADPFAEADFAPLARHLLPAADEDERRAAAERLRRYFMLAWRVYERLLRDPEAQVRFRALTDDAPGSTMTSPSTPPPGEENPPPPCANSSDTSASPP